MQKGWKKIGLSLVAVSLSLVLLASACIPQVAKAGPEKEKVLKVGIQGILTGPLATAGVPITYGCIDSLRYINEQGGINGVKIGIEWEDSREEVPRVIMAHKRFKQKGVVVEWGTIAATFETLAMLCPKDEIPSMIYDAFTPLGWTEPVRWLFGIAPSWDTVAVTIGGWIIKKWAEEHPDRPVRIGAIRWDDPAARNMVAGLAENVPRLGGEFVGIEVLPKFGVIDTSTEWLRMMTKEPDWVYLHTFGSGMVVLVKDGVRLGCREKGIQLFGGTACVEESHARVMGEAAEGLYTALVSGVSSMAAELPGMKPPLEAAAKYRGYKPEEVSLLYIAAWTTSMIIAEALRIAIEKVGYENVTGPVVRDALANIKNFDTGLMPDLVTMSDKKPWAQDSGWIFVIKEGRLWYVDEAPLDWYPEWLRQKIGLE